jgi:hypothetical protein
MSVQAVVWGNRELPLSVQCFQDGTLVCALIGINLQEGIAGFGDTLQEALRDLADLLVALEAHRTEYSEGASRS